MAKNCHTCKHLEWLDGEAMDGSDSGWGCNKRDEGGANIKLMRQLEADAYRNRYKRCHEQKDAP